MKQSVKLGNPKSNVAICTLWTPIELVERAVGSDNYAIIGQLYTKDAGVNNILRYCLNNKNIRYILICGQDRTRSGEALLNLMKRGIEKDRTIKETITRVDREVPVGAIERFRKNVKPIDCRNVADYRKLNDIIRKLPELNNYGEPESYPEAKIELPQSFPTSPVVNIRAKTIAEAWLQMLSAIMKLGKIKKPQHEESQKEVACLVTAITDEEPDNGKWQEYMTFPKEELEELKKTPHTRRAAALLYKVELDTDSKNPPCLCAAQAILHDGKLHLLAYMRSSDAYGAWPKNAYALRKLQKNICSGTKNRMGELITIAASSHIYDRHLRHVREILKDNPPGERIKFDLPRSTGNLDARGNIHIELKGGRIRIAHLSREGNRLEEFLAKDAKEAAKWLILEHKISEMPHALYIGQELAKAEMALNKKMKYVQDAA